MTKNRFNSILYNWKAGDRMEAGFSLNNTILHAVSQFCNLSSSQTDRIKINEHLSRVLKNYAAMVAKGLVENSDEI